MVNKSFQLFFMAFLVMLLLGFFYIKYVPFPTFKVAIEEVNIPSGKISTISTFEGKRLVQAICSKCHYNYELKTLAGRHHGNPGRLGEFYSTNITQDKTSGIGNWSNKDLYFFLKTGVKRNGKLAFDMPKYPNLSDRDLFSLIAFLKSDDPLVLATKHDLPPPDYSLITKILLHFWLRPVEYNGPVTEPDTTDILAFGKYLATAKFSCFDCHSGNSVTNDYLHPEKSWRYFQGGNPHVNEEREKVYSLNLTPDKESGIGNWSEEQFIKAVKYGVKPNGKPVQDPMFPFPMLTDHEIKAIYSYLQSIEPVHNAY